MLSEMRLRELGVWAAMFSLDPWGEERADLRAGIVASTIANAHRGKRQDAFSPLDFMAVDPVDRPKPTLAKRLLGFLKSIGPAKKQKQPKKKKG